MITPAPTVSGAIVLEGMSRSSLNVASNAGSVDKDLFGGVRLIATTLGSVRAITSTSVCSSCATAVAASVFDIRGGCATPASGIAAANNTAMTNGGFTALI